MADQTTPSQAAAREVQIVLNTDSGASIEAPASLILIAILSVLTPQQQTQIFNRVVNSMARGRVPVINPSGNGGSSKVDG